MVKILIFGHKNPDTDSICSAIALSHLKEKLNIETEATRLGEINEETRYVLEHFEVKVPRLVEEVANETNYVILVDHNEFQQSVKDIEKVRILEVVDHHKIDCFRTEEPLYFRCEPVGCTSTIIAKMYKENGVNIPKTIAGLLLSAIISDTLLFKSPTCTEEDIVIAKKLAHIADIDIEKYGVAMLNAGTNLNGKTVEQLLTMDAKEFQLGRHNIIISQVNTVDPNELYERQVELEEVMKKTIREKGLSLFLFSAVDILKSNSTILALGNLTEIVEAGFKIKLDDNKAKLKGVVSRKKQLLPALSKAFDQIK